MKKIKTLMSMLAFPFAALAQAPTLTAANTSPVAGQTSRFFEASANPGTINPGGAGANQTWDFSNLSYSPLDTLTYNTCTGNGCSDYPGATLRANTNYSSGNYQRQYYKANASALSHIGRSSSSSMGPSGGSYDVKEVFSKERDLLRYPMSFGNTFTSTWGAYRTTNINTGAYGLGGTDTVTADAWGTIKTPAGTFTALRVRIGFSAYDTFAFGGPPRVFTNGVFYRWYDGVNKEPIYSLQVATSSNGSPMDYGVYYKTPASIAGVGTLAGNPFSWHVAPNPATGNRIQVMMQGKNSAAVSLRLVDLMGRQVRNLATQQVGNGTLVLETTELPAGTYILSVVADGEPQGAQCVTIFQ